MATRENQALADLFDCNLPPSPQQYCIAQTAITSFNQELAAISEQMSDLERRLTSLRAEKVAIEARRQQYLDVVSARRRIPTEILSAFIETACLDSPKSHVGAPPFLPFMLVSRVWFRAACGIFDLWSELDINLKSDCREEDVQHIVERASRWYSRAGSHPLKLSLSLSSPNPHNHIFFRYLHSIFRSLGSLAMKIEMDTPSDLEILKQILHNPDSSQAVLCPQMRALHIHLQCKEGLSQDLRLQDAFSNASEQFPALHDFAICSNGTTAKFSIPWDALTKLRLGPFANLAGMTYYSVLQECRHLRSLHIDIDFWFGVNSIETLEDLTQGPVTLPHLTQLSVVYGCSHDAICTNLVNNLVLPSLVSLHLETNHLEDRVNYVLSAFGRLVRRSHNSNTLKSMSLSLGIALSYCMSGLSDLCCEVPALEVLELSGQSIGGGLVDAIPPRLKKLTVELTCRELDRVRPALGLYLKRRYSSLDTSAEDAPLRVRLRVVEGERSRWATRQIEELKSRIGSGLDLVMD
ncbi:hypothetical protein EST38_g10760 [Candolleomyces aberdarensis]|uniref:F-box domain-containing protein n=1 Tax=Candolleomyces aberdarensis TaxID=2316362 RepID=A0A4Q2D9F5_9AGAR|nr:hypothetical protein EST38_g10760 [Candolleomyces aberdarensis]